MIRHLVTGILLALFLATYEEAAQQVIVEMTPESIDEAIRLAADEKATAKFLDAYVVQTRAGWGNGPLLGVSVRRSRGSFKRRLRHARRATLSRLPT